MRKVFGALIIGIMLLSMIGTAFGEVCKLKTNQAYISKDILTIKGVNIGSEYADIKGYCEHNGTIYEIGEENDRGTFYISGDKQECEIGDKAWSVKGDCSTDQVTIMKKSRHKRIAEPQPPIKTPEEICLENPDKEWVDGECVDKEPEQFCHWGFVGHHWRWHCHDIA